MAENLGRTNRATPWPKDCDGCSGASYRRHTPSDLGRWQHFPAGSCAEHGVTCCYPTCCLLDRRPSRSRRDVVPMMPLSWFALQTTARQRWSGLSLTPVKHAYEMGTSELHRTSIMLATKALTTYRSMYPKGLTRKPHDKAERTRGTKSSALAAKLVCPKSLDSNRPVTEILSLTRCGQVVNSQHPSRLTAVSPERT